MHYKMEECVLVKMKLRRVGRYNTGELYDESGKSIQTTENGKMPPQGGREGGEGGREKGGVEGRREGVKEGGRERDRREEVGTTLEYCN